MNKQQFNKEKVLPPLSSKQTVCDGIYYDPSVSRRVNRMLNCGTPWKGDTYAGVSSRLMMGGNANARF